ncbi:MAG: flippase-like domain-containing protein [Deltaproteobacteria bacterium]|nr:flippase-like domain-containing protein [Deltaproteobacteria bacterium]
MSGAESRAGRGRWLSRLLLAVGVAILVALIVRSGPARLLDLAARADKTLWLGGVAFYIGSMVLRALKWHRLLGVVRPVSLSRTVGVFLVNAVAGNLTPFRSGEAVGPVLFQRHLGVPLGDGFSVIVVDRVLELLAMLVYLAAAFLYLDTHLTLEPLFRAAVFVAVAGTLVITAGLLAVLAWEAPGRWLVQAISRIPALQRRAPAIRAELERFYAFRRRPGVFGALPVLAGLTLASWAVQFGALWCVAASMTDVGYLATAAGQSISIPASLLSFIPAGIGVGAASFQYVMELLGYAPDPMVGAALLGKVLFLGLIIALGWVGSAILDRPQR